MKVCKMSIVLAFFGLSEFRGHGYWLGLGFIEPFRLAANQIHLSHVIARWRVK